MIEQLLKDIVKTEDEWDAKVRNSSIRAKEIVVAAGVQSVEIEKETTDKIKVLESANVAKAEAKAEGQCNDIAVKAEADAKEIIKQADKLSSKVASDIIGRLEKKYA